MSSYSLFTIVIAALTAASSCSSADLEGYEVLSSRIEYFQTDPTTPSETFMVRSYGDHRVRIERVCGSDHCRTIGFLEYLPGEFPRTVEESREIRELSDSIAAFVRDVVVIQAADKYSFDLVAENTYVGGPLFTLRVTPTNKSRYEAVFTSRNDGLAPPQP